MILKTDGFTADFLIHNKNHTGKWTILVDQTKQKLYNSAIVSISRSHFIPFIYPLWIPNAYFVFELISTADSIALLN